MDMNTNVMNFLFKEMFLILVAILTINYNLKSFLFFYYLYLVIQLKVLEKSRCYFFFHIISTKEKVKYFFLKESKIMQDNDRKFHIKSRN